MDLGLYLPDAPGIMAGVDAWSRRLNGRLRYLSVFQAWGSAYRNFWAAEMAAIAERGMVPMITWEPWRLPEPGKHPVDQLPFRLESIVAGRHDPYVRGFARACRQHERPILLRPMHEMNGDWYPWCGTVNGNSPEEYVIAWRHLRSLFAEEDAHNVQWVWCPYSRSYPDSDDNQIERYFPGDDAIDWAALDGYNWGASDPRHRWESFDELFAAAYEKLSLLTSRPILVAEVGSAEEGGDKAAWIEGMFRSLDADYPRVHGVVWFHADKERNWKIDSSAGALEAFLSGAIV